MGIKPPTIGFKLQLKKNPFKKFFHHRDSCGIRVGFPYNHHLLGWLLGGKGGVTWIHTSSSCFTSTSEWGQTWGFFTAGFLLMVQKSGTLTSWYGLNIPWFIRVLYIPGGCLGFLPSIVWPTPPKTGFLYCNMVMFHFHHYGRKGNTWYTTLISRPFFIKQCHTPESLVLLRGYARGNWCCQIVK